MPFWMGMETLPPGRGTIDDITPLVAEVAEPLTNRDESVFELLFQHLELGSATYLRVDRIIFDGLLKLFKFSFVVRVGLRKLLLNIYANVSTRRLPPSRH